MRRHRSVLLVSIQEVQPKLLNLGTSYHRIHPPHLVYDEQVIPQFSDDETKIELQTWGEVTYSVLCVCTCCDYVKYCCRTPAAHSDTHLGIKLVVLKTCQGKQWLPIPNMTWGFTPTKQLSLLLLLLLSHHEKLSLKTPRSWFLPHKTCYRSLLEAMAVHVHLPNSSLVYQISILLSTTYTLPGQ